MTRITAGSLIVLISISLNYAQNDGLKMLLDKVNQDSLFYFVECLTGEREVTINGKKVRISERSSSQGNTNAELFIEQTLSSYGLKVEKQKYSSSGTNVYAIQKGSTDRKYIFSGHYDSADKNCPGADDNASAVAAVLEASRILHDASTEASIEYALWDEEESGSTLMGSTAYAKNAKSTGEIITGVINLDMLGYDGNNDYTIDINQKNTGSNNPMTSAILEVQKKYVPKIKTLIPAEPGPSDHKSFWNNGFNAIGVEEDWQGKDENPHYHKASDKISNMSKDYFFQFSKLMIGTLALVTKISPPTPLQFAIQTTRTPSVLEYHDRYIRYKMPYSGDATIAAFTLQGEKIRVYKLGFLDKGIYQNSEILNSLPRTSVITLNINEKTVTATFVTRSK